MSPRFAVLLGCLALSALAACNATPPSEAADPATPMTSADTGASTTADSPTPAPPAQETGQPPAGQGNSKEDTAMTGYRAFGNEPFWSARVSGDTLVFSTPEDQAGRSMRGQRVPSLRGFTFVGTDEGMEFNLDIQQGTCSDGMSDQAHAYTSTFLYRGTTYKGCAEVLK
jgi:uncharacterized membrane protein